MAQAALQVLRGGDLAEGVGKRVPKLPGCDPLSDFIQQNFTSCIYPRQYVCIYVYECCIYKLHVDNPVSQHVGGTKVFIHRERYHC